MHKICFLHIPRTAGTSFVMYLRSLYGSDSLIGFPNQSYYDQADKEQLDKYQLYGGHTNWKIREILEKDVKYVTFLGEPVNRTLSHVLHMQRNGHLPRGSWDKTFSDEVISESLVDYQIRVLVPEYQEMSRKDALDLAIARLGELDFVGIKECYIVSVHACLTLFGISQGEKSPKSGVYSGRSAQLSISAYRKVRELIKYDTILYNIAKERLWQHINKDRI